jgi:YHS domain-containing protein
MRAAIALVLALAGCPKDVPKSRGYDEPPLDGVSITDPVSGVSCEKDQDTLAAVYEDRTYYFCAGSSPSKFSKAPAKYAD